MLEIDLLEEGKRLPGVSVLTALPDVQVFPKAKGGWSEGT